jgi:hypothetical protein
VGPPPACGRPLASRSQDPSSVSKLAFRRQTSAVGAACRNPACADRCGGRRVNRRPYRDTRSPKYQGKPWCKTQERAKRFNNIEFPEQSAGRGFNSHSRLQFFPAIVSIKSEAFLTSCWMDEPERLQLAARGLQFGKPAAFLLQQVILHSARTFGCFENVFPLCSTFAEQNRVAFRRFR